jgi:hypothetical protein
VMLHQNQIARRAAARACSLCDPDAPAGNEQLLESPRVR